MGFSADLFKDDTKLKVKQKDNRFSLGRYFQPSVAYKRVKNSINIIKCVNGGLRQL